MWQKNTRQQLQQQSQRLKKLLAHYQLSPTGSTHLFQWVQTEKAAQIHRLLAEQAIFTRLFNQPASLRFGLPADEPEWQHLQSALLQVSIEMS